MNGSVPQFFFVYDEGAHLIGKYDGNGNLLWETAWLGDLPVAAGSPAGLFYIAPDHQATKLHYNYFRDYDPRLGRYIESDPIGLAAGINTYAYAKGNPVSLVDPLGLTIGGVFGKLLNQICPPDDSYAARQRDLNIQRQDFADNKPPYGGNVIPLPGSPGAVDVEVWNLAVINFNLDAALHNQSCPGYYVAPLDTITFN